MLKRSLFLIFLLFPSFAYALEYAGPTSPQTPSWTKSLIIYQMRVDQFTPQGTFQAATTKLDYLAGLGITAIQLDPVAEFDGLGWGKETRLSNQVYYGTRDPDKLDPLLGTDQDFQNFVSAAHQRGIKVIQDIRTRDVSPSYSEIQDDSSWPPLAGDWDGDGKTTTGVYSPRLGQWFLSDKNFTWPTDDIVFRFGAGVVGGDTMQPVSGRMQAGDTKDSIGFYDANGTTQATSPGTFFLKNLDNTLAIPAFKFTPGSTGDALVAVMGDWTGKGYDSVGVYDQTTGTFYLKNSNTAGAPDIQFIYGPAGNNWIPLAGDWVGQGHDGVGLYDPATATFYLKNSLAAGLTDNTFVYGALGWKPIVGDWTGKGFDSVGVYDPTGKNLYLKNTNSGGNGDIVFNDSLHSPEYDAHPNWFTVDNSDGSLKWNWNMSDVQNWWEGTIVNDWILKYQLDGVHLDLDPTYSISLDGSQPRGVWTKVKQMAATAGRDIVVISENSPEYYTTEHNRIGEVDFSQEDFGVSTFYTGPYFIGCRFLSGVTTCNPNNIVSTIKGNSYPASSGNYNFGEDYYTYALSDHDRLDYNAKGRPVYFGYGMLFGPFIPFWYMGEEFNNPKTNGPTASLYSNSIDWNATTTNQAFLNKIKQMIQIHKTYSNIFGPSAAPLNQTNIVAVPSTGTDLQTYAMWNGSSAIVVAGKVSAASGQVTMNVPLSQMGLAGQGQYTVTDLMASTTQLVSEAGMASLSANLNQGDVFALKIDPAPVSVVKYPRTIKLSSLEGLASIVNYPTLTAKIISPTSGTTLETQVVNADALHNYSVTFLSGDPQIVNIRISALGYLTRLLSGVDTTVNSSSSFVVSQLLAGDFNGDNVVNTLDYSAMNSHWLQNYSAADINKDGLINSLDFAILKNNFGKVGE